MRSRWISNEPGNNSKAAGALRAAFKHEVRPEEYLFRVWVTAIIVGAFIAYYTASKSGQFELSLLVPLGGVWNGHDPSGGLYMQTWGDILANALQAGFALWGAALLFLGFFRIFSAHKYVFACFYLGIAFLGFAWMLPGWTEILLRMLIEKCPILVQ